MITLITLLISILGYGSPADFSHLNEAELNDKIEMAQSDGGTQGWDFPGVTSE